MSYKITKDGLKEALEEKLSDTWQSGGAGREALREELRSCFYTDDSFISPIEIINGGYFPDGFDTPADALSPAWWDLHTAYPATYNQPVTVANSLARLINRSRMVSKIHVGFGQYMFIFKNLPQPGAGVNWEFGLDRNNDIVTIQCVGNNVFCRCSRQFGQSLAKGDYVPFGNAVFEIKEENIAAIWDATWDTFMLDWKPNRVLFMAGDAPNTLEVVACIAEAVPQRKIWVSIFNQGNGNLDLDGVDLAPYDSVLLSMMPYDFYDYDALAFTNVQSSYTIGTNAAAADPNYPDSFAARELVLIPTQDCDVRLEGDSTVQARLFAGNVYRFKKGIRTVYAVRVTTNGTLHIYAEG